MCLCLLRKRGKKKTNDRLVIMVGGGEGGGVLLWGFEFRKVSGLCWGCDRMAKE